jgi:hypothetical protein
VGSALKAGRTVMDKALGPPLDKLKKTLESAQQVRIRLPPPHTHTQTIGCLSALDCPHTLWVPPPPPFGCPPLPPPQSTTTTTMYIALGSTLRLYYPHTHTHPLFAPPLSPRGPPPPHIIITITITTCTPARHVYVVAIPHPSSSRGLQSRGKPASTPTSTVPGTSRGSSTDSPRRRWGWRNSCARTTPFYGRRCALSLQVPGRSWRTSRRRFVASSRASRPSCRP